MLGAKEGEGRDGEMPSRKWWLRIMGHWSDSRYVLARATATTIRGAFHPRSGPRPNQGVYRDPQRSQTRRNHLCTSAWPQRYVHRMPVV